MRAGTGETARREKKNPDGGGWVKVEKKAHRPGEAAASQRPYRLSGVAARA